MEYKLENNKLIETKTETKTEAYDLNQLKAQVEVYTAEIDKYKSLLADAKGRLAKAQELGIIEITVTDLNDN